MEWHQILNIAGAALGMTLMREYLSWRKRRLTAEDTEESGEITDTGSRVNCTLTQVSETSDTIEQRASYRRLPGPRIE